MDISLKGITFDRGIDRIITPDETPQGRLPTEGRLAPSGEAVTPKLDQLLKTPNLADGLAAELAPRIDERDVLLPDQFHRTMTEVRAMLGKEAANHPQHKAVFRDAAAVLKEEGDLRDLVDMYRSALFKG